MTEATWKENGQCVIGKKFIERFPERQVCCPDYRFFYQDEEVLEYAKSIKKFVLCKEASLIHHSANFYKNEMDETHKISRDEIKWAKFLERQQEKICETLTDTFLLHLDFTGLKEQYGITKDKINIKMNPPSHYKEQMEQNFIESRFNNYTLLADREEFSKYFLMKKMLKWDDDDIKENKESFKKDKEMLPKEEDEGEEE